MIIIRKTRQKVKGESCYYHLMSRISGSPGDFPFGDVEKESSVSDTLIGEFILLILRNLQEKYLANNGK